jgi:eukaryotic-like serine/threonine-protein kinase
MSEQQLTESGDVSQDPAFAAHFELLSRIGEGGMSQVYKARDKELDCIVAIKLLQPSSASNKRMLARVRREAKVLSELHHPNIVKVKSLGISHSQPYLVMEYIEGKPLSSILAEGPISLEHFRRLFEPILSGLVHAHERGIVHRDLKPDNLMILTNQAAEVEIPKIVDFGIAKLSNASSHEFDSQKITSTGALIGTPAYMSPEQLLGAPVDQRSDIYSICCVMYEALAGSQRFQSRAQGYLPPQLIETNASIELPNLGPIVENLKLVLQRGMCRNPEDRYATTKDLEFDFRRALAGEQITPPRELSHQIRKQRLKATKGN